MRNSRNLLIQKVNKKDEFYTQLSDIENELRHYKEHFEGKVIFCNCDDPYESNFFKYFALNFNRLKLKKIIATGYATSPVAGQEINLFEDEIETPKNQPYAVFINEVSDFNGDGRIDLADVKFLLQMKKNVRRKLHGDENFLPGDFRSKESISLLKQADIVCTNPPFSLFREYVSQLVEYNKKFLIIGNVNAINYKVIFPLIKDNKMWIGYKFNGKPMLFSVPDNYELKGSVHGYFPDGKKFIGVGGTCWYTNLDIQKRHEYLDLYKEYNPDDYPKYDNYDAINVNKTSDIPCDYDGVMGVPVTFLDKYNPNQFEIIGCTQRGCHNELPDIKKYDDYWEVRQDGTKTGSSGSKTNENGNLAKNDGKHNYFINSDGHIVQSTYGRIFIKRKSTVS